MNIQYNNKSSLVIRTLVCNFQGKRDRNTKTKKTLNKGIYAVCKGPQTKWKFDTKIWFFI